MTVEAAASTYLGAEFFPDVRSVSIAVQGFRHATFGAARENTYCPYTAVN